MKTEFIALIPARGGSKGIPGKNITPFLGKPLIAHTINAALTSEHISHVFVTTDDEEIARVAESWGAKVPFLRPVGISGDTSRTIDAVLHFIENMRGVVDRESNLVLLQPTSPLRGKDDIDVACKMFLDNQRRGLASVTFMKKPLSLIRTCENLILTKVFEDPSDLRRQEARYSCYINGAIYINRISEIHPGTVFNDNELAFVMDAMKSVDIDDPLDLEEAAFYYRIIQGKHADVIKPMQ